MRWRDEAEWERATHSGVPADEPVDPLELRDRIKETCRLIRLARSHWDAHHNAACRLIRGRALRMYETLTPEQKKEVPQVLRVWLRYRSEKYFGSQRGKGAHARKKPKGRS